MLKISRSSESVRVADDLNLFTGMTKQEIRQDLNTKQGILDWLVKNKVDDVDDVGKVISHYYTNPQEFFKIIGRRDARKILLEKTIGRVENEE